MQIAHNHPRPASFGHLFDAARLVLLTQISTGSRTTSDRTTLAQDIRAARRQQASLWQTHGTPNSFRILS